MVKARIKPYKPDPSKTARARGNAGKPKYSDPSKEAERIKNLPPEKIRTPASRKFAGREIIDWTV